MAECHFDLGTREKVDERTVYHGMGWLTDDDTLVLHPSPDVCIRVLPDGEARVWTDGGRAW